MRSEPTYTCTAAMALRGEVMVRAVLLGALALPLQLLGFGLSTLRLMHFMGWKVTLEACKHAQHTVWHVTGPWESC